ncbi:RNA polymerase sigma factor [Nitriliruptor alkaliphilus]|uniref:RNA polymerase sigma factor n=1 Tax=Nitriliruptor alkaliphilus TaxID=427918 RepID=UPI0006963AE3|nr:sigma-70 family RNA polymerase sigma factor [Nitriliruptor alkaliphilus]
MAAAGRGTSGHDPGDVAAFCRREHRRLVGLLALYVGDRAVAEELAQETLVRVCEQWPKVRAMTNPSGWASRVALNLASSRWRRLSAERRATVRHGADPDRAQDVDTAATVAVRSAVAALPPRQKQALVLRYYADLSVADVADAMDCPVGTAKSLLSRATAALRDEAGLIDLDREDDRVS